MTTTGERLVAISTLTTGTAMDHFLNISTGGGGGLVLADFGDLELAPPDDLVLVGDAALDLVGDDDVGLEGDGELTLVDDDDLEVTE